MISINILFPGTQSMGSFLWTAPEMEESALPQHI